MSLYKKLEDYKKKDFIPFHMPGHKRNVAKFGMSDVAQIDITEIDGFDDYHYPQEVIKEIQEAAADIYGTKHSFYLVNGSTSGLLTAISAVTEYGDRIIVARNCHKAVYNGCIIRGLVPGYVYPQYYGKCGILSTILPEDVEKSLINSHAKAVVITSPTYEGIVSDIEAIADICHKNGAVLIVDEAHGAHFNFSEKFPKTAMKCGADIVIESLHKTLPCYTQTAILHVCGERVDVAKVRRYLSIYQTSSPSYIFMAGINRCIDYMVSDKGRADNEEYIRNLINLRGKLAGLKNIKLLEPQELVSDYDISKIVLCVPHEGAILYERLLKEYHIQVEMVATDYVICMTSIGDDFSWYDKLSAALFKLDLEFGNDLPNETADFVNIKAQIMGSPAKALECDGVEYDFRESCGKISLESVYAYPPGIPLIFPGELITEEIVEEILRLGSEGITIKGFRDNKGDRILCIE